jgi:hypothetical protein
MRSPCQGFDESNFGGSECRFLCRFLDAGNDDLTTRSDDRRPKSAKARSRGELGNWLAASAMGI